MRERRLFLFFVDLLLINAAVIFALVIWSVRGDKDLLNLLITQAYWFALLSALWVMFMFLTGLYDLRIVIQLTATTRALVATFFLVLVAYLMIFFAAATELPRGVVVYHGIATVTLIALWRGMYIRLAPSSPFRRRALIVGAGRAGQLIAQTIQTQFDPHYELVGFVDDNVAKHGRRVNDLAVLSGHADLVRLVREHRIVEIILAITRDISDDLFRALMEVQELGVTVTPMPLIYEEITGRVPVEHIADSWYVALPLRYATNSVLAFSKRIFDLVIAGIGALAFGLILPFIALAIKLDSKGAIFYSQERVGQGGRIFKVSKLRTMITNAEQNGQAVWATKNDPRVTRVGKLLRKIHLDEFPQFWNVLRGEMSIVGPRPERPEFVAKLEKQIPFYRLRHAVKPGMAGWALTNADYVDSLEDARLRVEYDLYYIKHQSLWLDIWILFRTGGHVLSFKGR